MFRSGAFQPKMSNSFKCCLAHNEVSLNFFHLLKLIAMCINVSYPIPSIGRYQINGGGGGSVVNARPILFKVLLWSFHV